MILLLSFTRFFLLLVFKLGFYSCALCQRSLPLDPLSNDAINFFYYLHLHLNFPCFFSFIHLGTEHSKYRLSCSYSVYINEFVNVCDGIVISLFFMCAFKSCFWYCCCGCWCCRKAFHSLKLIMNTLDFILNRRWSCQPFPIVNELASFLHLSSACFWWSISETRASSVGGFP